MGIHIYNSFLFIPNRELGAHLAENYRLDEGDKFYFFENPTEIDFPPCYLVGHTEPTKEETNPKEWVHGKTLWFDLNQNKVFALFSGRATKKTSKWRETDEFEAPRVVIDFRNRECVGLIVREKEDWRKWTVHSKSEDVHTVVDHEGEEVSFSDFLREAEKAVNDEA